MILDLWNKYHEVRCGWVITKFLSAEEIRPIIDELSYESNYYNLCRRFAQEPWFHIDSAKIIKSCDSVRLIWIMSQSASVMPIANVRNLLYGQIMTFLADIKKITNNNDASRYINEKICTDWSSDCEDFLFVHRISDIEKILSSMCSMGYADEVLHFVSLDSRIHNEFWTVNKDMCQRYYSKNDLLSMVSAYIEKFLSLAPSDILLVDSKGDCEESDIFRRDDDDTSYGLSQYDPDPFYGKAYLLEGTYGLGFNEDDMPY